MPRIISPFAEANSDISDSLKSIGTDMFANAAQKALIREEALKAARQNTAAPLVGQAYRDNNPIEMGAQELNYDPTSTAMGHQQLARAAVAPGATPGSLGTMQIGAGEGIDATVQGQNAALANATQRTAMDIAGAQHRQDTDPYATADANGDPIIATKGTAPGTRPPATEDRIIAAYLQKQLDAQNGTVPAAPTAPPQAPAAPVVAAPPAAAPPAAPPPATPPVLPVMPSSPSNAPHAVVPQAPPAAAAPSPVPAAQPAAPAPQTNSFPGLIQGHPGPPPPLIQARLGMKPETFINAATGQFGITYDGGNTVHDARDNNWYQGIGNGWQPASPADALTQARTNALQTEAAKPLPVPPAGFPQSAVDAGHLAGVDSLAQHVVPDIWQGFTGTEWGPTYNRARESLDNLAMNTRAIVANAPGARTALADRQLVLNNMPVPGKFTGMTGASALEEKNSTISFIKGLRGIYTAEQTEATNPNTPPADVEKITQHMRALREVIAQWETMPAQTAPAAPAAAAPLQKNTAPGAPGQPPVQTPTAQTAIPPRATNIKIVNGKTLYMLDGQLMQQ